MEGSIPNSVFLIAIIFITYFFLIAPGLKQRKRERQFNSNLKKGDRVITKSGIHAKIAALNDKDNTCVIETLAGKIKIERSALSIEMSQKLNNPNK